VASGRGRKNTVLLLLENGACVNPNDEEYCHALGVALERDHDDIVQLFLREAGESAARAVRAAALRRIEEVIGSDE
jgi:hypothetical protein